MHFFYYLERRKNFYLFFFFQAEDGIRDVAVTGVQTCALPIWDGHVADFINDWGVTFDPRNLALNLPSKIPFVLFPKQREWVDWVCNYLWKNNKDGLTDKSREIGVSW